MMKQESNIVFCSSIDLPVFMAEPKNDRDTGMRKRGWTGAMMLIASIAPDSVLALPAAQAADPVAVVEGQIRAFNDGDVDRFAAFYAEDVELFDLGSQTKPTLSGRAALIGRYKPMLTKYRPKATVIKRIVSGNFVIDNEKTEAGGRSSQGVAIYQVESGKIRRVWFTP